MSAFIVSKAHIDVLVNAAAQLGVITTRGEALSTGMMLLRENYRAVNHRYGESAAPPRYRATTTEAEFDPAAICKVIACYVYQIAEPPDWRETQAYAWCEKLRAAAEAMMSPDDLILVRDLDRMVPAYRKSSVYERTPWDVESIDDVPLSQHSEAARTTPVYPCGISACAHSTLESRL